ncbi:hypothetical protein NTGHW29_200044 [Candidatus Nitrotoga sp. HW29]|nr:hypothetical protein NTGHW29_200044 [Candidatus Nitrotoga sp. HW29]
MALVAALLREQAEIRGSVVSRTRFCSTVRRFMEIPSESLEDLTVYPHYRSQGPNWLPFVQITF